MSVLGRGAIDQVGPSGVWQMSLPQTPGLPGQVLSALDGLGNTAWSTPAGATTPGAPAGSVQFNKGGVFTGDATFTFDDTTEALSVDRLVLTSLTDSELFAFFDDNGAGGNMLTFKTVPGVGNKNSGLLLTDDWTDHDTFVGLQFYYGQGSGQIYLSQNGNTGLTTGALSIYGGASLGLYAGNGGRSIVMDAGGLQASGVIGLFWTTNAGVFRTGSSNGDAVFFQIQDVDLPGALTFMSMVAGNVPVMKTFVPNGGRTILDSSRLAVGDDIAPDVSGNYTTFTNVRDNTLGNPYVVQGGQAAATVNTGWLKVYVGTAVAWVPYWQNATP